MTTDTRPTICLDAPDRRHHQSTIDTDSCCAWCLEPFDPLPSVRYFATRDEAKAAGLEAAPAASARYVWPLRSGYAEVNYGRPWLVEWYNHHRGPQRVLTESGWRTHAQGFTD